MPETTRIEGAQPAPTTSGPMVERLHVRNYDGRTPYTVTVTVDLVDGRGPELERTFTVPAGQTAGEIDDPPPGRYVVTANTADGGTSRTTCWIDETPAGTAVVELGNGAVSVREGFR